MESKSNKSVAQKLGLNQNSQLKIWNAPEDNSLLQLWNTAGFWRYAENDTIGNLDNALIIFVINKEQLDLAFEKVQKNGLDPKPFWILYPKKKSKIQSDLNLMYNWEALIPKEWAPCGSAAIDEDWTALKFKKADQIKISGLGNAQIKESQWNEYIDVDNKIIKLPLFMEEQLAMNKSQINKNQSCLDYFKTLSYSNRKEYLLWVLSAKQVATQQSRLERAITLLSLGAKNPADKKNI